MCVPRKLRFIPEESLVEITCRTIHGRFLLRPGPALNNLIIGVLARGQRATGTRICAFVYLSNHYHLLIRVRDAREMAEFMRYVNSNIAREVARLYSWREKVWARRYTDIVVSHEPEAQFQRLHYLLVQGVKERLVASPLHWPGASSTASLANGTSLRGVWIDRTSQYRAHLAGAATADYRFSTVETLELSPLPCLEEEAPARRQALVRRMIRKIVSRSEAERGSQRVLGREAVLRQDPFSRPATSKRSPAPRFHAVAPRVRRALEDIYRHFRISYGQAREDLRSGRGDLSFPAGSFLGPGDFVPLVA